MKTIYKYNVPLDGGIIHVPLGSIFLSVQKQGGSLVAYYEVENNTEREQLEQFYTTGTGLEIDEHYASEYLNSFMFRNDSFVVHVYKTNSFHIVDGRGERHGKSVQDGGTQEMIYFTDQKPHEATVEDLNARWGGGKPGERFRCMLCGYKFKLGDIFRWVFTNDIPGAIGNPLVCQKCDGPDVREKWKKLNEEFYRDQKFWWFRRHEKHIIK